MRLLAELRPGGREQQGPGPGVDAGHAEPRRCQIANAVTASQIGASARRVDRVQRSDQRLEMGGQRAGVRRRGHPDVAALACELDRERLEGTTRRARVSQPVRVVRNFRPPAVAFPMATPGPAAGPTPTLFQLFSCPSDTTRSRHVLLGVLDPADELVSGKRSDVLPGVERSRACDERLAKVCGDRVHHSTGYSPIGHVPTVAGGLGEGSRGNRRPPMEIPETAQGATDRALGHRVQRSDRSKANARASGYRP